MAPTEGWAWIRVPPTSKVIKRIPSGSGRVIRSSRHAREGPAAASAPPAAGTAPSQKSHRPGGSSLVTPAVPLRGRSCTGGSPPAGRPRRGETTLSPGAPRSAPTDPPESGAAGLGGPPDATRRRTRPVGGGAGMRPQPFPGRGADGAGKSRRSEEHTSELQSLTNLVCRLV